MATQRVTIAAGDIAAHELAMTPGDVLVVKWTDRINAVEVINHGGNSAWFTAVATGTTAPDRMPTIRGGHCRVALPWSSTTVNQLTAAAYEFRLIAEYATTVTLIAS